MTRDKFKLIHSELIMQVQCIEHDLKLIYAGMCKGDFDKNLDALEKVNLGSMIKKVKELDYSDGPILLNGTICCWRKFEKSEIIGVTNALLTMFTYPMTTRVNANSKRLLND